MNAQTSSPSASPAPLVVFDFDHTLYDGDSGTHLIRWLIGRRWWRMLLALLIAPLFAPMIAFLPTRRMGISGFVWAGTVGVKSGYDFNVLVDAYVRENAAQIRENLLPVALDVLHQHRVAGDMVIVATGAPPELARAILAFVAHEDIPVLGTLIGPRFGAMVAVRHCHYQMKIQMIREAGYTSPIAVAYTDSRADLPLLQAAQRAVVVNPKPGNEAIFQNELGETVEILHWGAKGRAGQVIQTGSDTDRK